MDGLDGQIDPEEGQVLKAYSARIQARLAAAVASERRCIRHKVGNPARPVVIVIDRDEPHPFYSSEDCEIVNAGRGRRSISNFGAICEALRAGYDNILVELLEGRSLAYQIALFEAADVVVAQHGGALANLIWARPGKSVLEIMPRNLDPPSKVRLFSNIAHVFRLHYTRIDQTDVHGAADISALMPAVASAVHC